MTLKTPLESPGDHPTTPLPATEMLYVLAKERRRTILRYLFQHERAVSMAELADHIMLGESGRTDIDDKQILAELHHVHLPMLAGYGLVCLNRERMTVELQPAVIDNVRLYLDLTGGLLPE